MSRIARLLNASLTVHRTVRTSDGMGGYTSVLTALGSVRARVSQPSATERVVAAQNGADLSHVVYLLPTADVLRGDELHRASDVFEVLAIFQPSEPNTYLRADCKLRQAGV
jgi:head-tail adaptor